MVKKLSVCFALLAVFFLSSISPALAGALRGRSFDVTFQLIDTTSNTPVTSGTVVVYVSKDGGAQAAATNSASHLGNGQWKLTLTATEMNANSVGLAITETGSYPVTLTIATDSTTPIAARYNVTYNERVTGNMPVSFTRGKTSVDGAGIPVAANERRFDGTSRAIVGHIDWRSTGYVAGGGSYIMGGGKDLDGGYVAVIREDSGSTVRIISVDDSRLVTREESRTSWNSFPGGGGAVSYAPQSAQVAPDGTIFLYLMRTTSGVYDGITFVYSQDKGASWTRITNVGGGTHMSPPASYGASADAVPRGGFWCLNIVPHGGLDAKGRPVNNNRMWLLWFDYLIGGNAGAKGHQCGMVELTRDSTDEHFTVGLNREVWSGYYASQVNNLHQHMFGMSGDGALIANLGDGISKWSTHLLTMDLDEYDNPATTVTVAEVSGQLKTTNAATGRMTPQIFGGAAAPNGDIFAGADTWPSPITRISNFATVAGPLRLNTPLFLQDDAQAGNFFDGWELFTICHTIGEGWTVGIEGTKNYMRLMSYDGEHWGIMDNCDILWGHIIICGDALVSVRTSDRAVVMAKKPPIIPIRSLLVGPGADNFIHNTTNLYQSVAPTAPNTMRRALWSGGRWIFGDDSTPIPNAPKTPPPNVNDGLGIYLGNESTASYDHGWLHVMDSGDTATIGNSDYIQTIYYIANLGSAAVGKFQTRITATSLVGDGALTTGVQPDRNAFAYDPWCNAWNAGDPTNTGIAASRLGYQMLSGPSSGTANEGCPMLVVFSTAHLGERTSWPTQRDSTGNNHEKEIWSIPPNPYGANTWKGSVVVGRHPIQASISGGYPSGPLFTWKRDSTNHVVVSWDRANSRVIVTATVNGTPLTTATPTDLNAEDWLRGSFINISLSDNGTDLLVSMYTNRNGIQTTTIGNGSIGYPTQLLIGDDDQSDVSNLMVAGGEIKGLAASFGEMAEEHFTLSYLKTDAELTAEIVTDQVNEKLEYAFADVPANVWLQSINTVQKAGTVGEAQLLTQEDAESLDTDWADGGRLGLKIINVDEHMGFIPEITPGDPNGLAIVNADGNVPADIKRINGFEEIDGFNTAQALAIIMANAAGEIHGSETDEPKLKSLDGAVDRISAEVDPDGDRTITIDVSDLVP